MTKYKVQINNANYFGFDDAYLDFPCTIDFTRFGQIDTPRAEGDASLICNEASPSFKVFVNSSEPKTSINRESITNTVGLSYQYDLILTSELQILSRCLNAKLLLYGGTWLNKKSEKHADALGIFDETILTDIPIKKFNISFLTTSHRGICGYEMRHIIWNTRHKINIPTTFYSSTRFPTLTPSTNTGKSSLRYSNTLHNGFLPNDNKIALFDSQFSITVESSIESSYFTEKLIDCLLTKTVPIYWGCPNIGEYFDTRGMIRFTTHEEMLNKINELDETSYAKMLPYIESNYEKAKEYGRSFLTRILEIVETKHTEQLSKKDTLWTIGILTLPQRQNSLHRLIDILEKSMPSAYRHRIEIILNSDDGTKTVGQKRNEILDSAKGKYISFIDDDDAVQYSYLGKIAMVLDTEMYDGVGFWGIYYHNGQRMMEFNHSNSNGGHFKQNGQQYRPLNHLNPVLTEYAKQIRFPSINFAEDADYCDRLLASGLIKHEYSFTEAMYHYLFDSNKTETQK